MGPHDDSVITQSQKTVSDLEVFDCEACDSNDSEDDSTRLNSNDTLKTKTSQNEKDFKKCEEIESDCSQANGNENEDEMGNLFRLSVLFVRGNSFDSLKHWKMRCRFLDANLRIGSMGRIREVDEEFLNISQKESGLSSRPLSRRGVRLIQVQPRENEMLQGSVEAKDAGSSELPKECCIEEYCKDSSNDLCGFSDDSESIIETNLPKIIASPQNAVVDDSKFKSATNKSVTSLADAIHQPDERKTFTYNSCGNVEKSLNASQSKEQIPKLPADLSGADQNPESSQTAAIERPGFFTKILRRILALFQGRKIDVWPGQNSQSFV